MNSVANSAADWQTANQRYLMAAVTVIQRRLEQHIAPIADREANQIAIAQVQTAQVQIAQVQMQKAASAIAAPSALELICVAFGLSEFERDVLLLCAAIELKAEVASLCAAAQGDAARAYATFGLALAALPNAHWSALTPDAPLLHWELIEVTAGITFTASPLRINLRVLNYLVGLQHLDSRLSSLVQVDRTSGDLVPSHQQIAVQIQQRWSHSANLPIVQLCGSDATSQRAIAASACRSIGLTLYRLSVDLLPTDSREFDLLIRLWEREAILSGAVLLLDCHHQERETDRAVAHWIDRLNAALIVSSFERRQMARSSFTFEVLPPDLPEQRQVWQRALGESAVNLNGQLDLLLAQFSLSSIEIQTISAESPDASTLWNACRMQTRPKLDDLAQRLDPIACWDDLILPPPQMQTLRTIAAQVRQRLKVYETWGFKTKGTRGLGISALFAGDSGTGKTLAAEVLAHELQLDLYRVDLSSVVSSTLR